MSKQCQNAFFGRNLAVFDPQKKGVKKRVFGGVFGVKNGSGPPGPVFGDTRVFSGFGPKNPPGRGSGRGFARNP